METYSAIIYKEVGFSLDDETPFGTYKLRFTCTGWDDKHEDPALRDAYFMVQLDEHETELPDWISKVIIRAAEDKAEQEFLSNLEKYAA